MDLTRIIVIFWPAYRIATNVGIILVYPSRVLISVLNEGDLKINECFFQTTCHHYHRGPASTLSVDIVQTFTYGACQILTIVFDEGLIRFLVMKKGPI